MSALDRNYKVEFLEGFFPVIRTDITNFVVSLDDVSFQDNGKLSTAKFTLNAEHGDFITNANGGVTPLLTQFDRIEITIIDDQGISKDSKIFEITTDLTQLTRQTQYYLPLELESRERNLKGVAFSGFFRDPPLNFHQIIEKIVQAYDAGISLTKQPFLVTDFMGVDQNEAPEFNPNIWDFTNVDNCYDALMHVLTVINLPVSAGGAGARFAVKFIDDPFTSTTLILRVLKQGENNVGSIPTLEQNTTNPIMKIDKIELPSSGTQVIARARAKTGHLYSDFDKFAGRLEFYRAIPFYDATITYPAGINVRVGTDRFVSNTDVPLATPPPSAEWTAIDVGDFVGDINYSPVTNLKLNEFLNGFGNPEAGFGITDFTTVGVPDSNVTIHDQDSSDTTIGTNRELVLLRTITDDLSADAFKKKYLAGSLSDKWLEGSQILIDLSLGALGGFFAADNYGTGAGVDPNGNAYSDAVVRYTEFSNISGLGFDWIVIREPLANDQIAVLSERRTYEWNVLFATVSNRNYPGTDRRRGGSPGTLAWRDITDQFLGNDCFHSPISVTQVDGLLADEIENDEPLNKPNGDPYIKDSAIQFTYGYNALGLSGPFESIWKTLFNVIVAATGITGILTALTVSAFEKFITPSYTSMGWWCSIPSPLALSTHNSVSEIGEVYGGNENDINEHRYFDLFNSTRTILGKLGYNQDDSDSLMEVTGFTLLMKFDITAAGVRVPFTGNIPFTHWALDKEGQMWKSPKKFIRKLGETDRLTFEYGDLTPAYYSRTPLGINNVIENILVPEIQKNKILFKENIILQGIQCELPYDVHGRYSVNLYESIIKPVFFNFFGGGSDDIRFIGIIDAVNWIKTPIAISKFDTDPNKRIINPDIVDYPNIVNIEQLQRFADAQEQVEVFQYTQYTTEQGGIADLSIEDSVFLSDPQMITESDDGPNTVKLAVRELHYSVPKNQGLIRKAVLVKVIT